MNKQEFMHLVADAAYMGDESLVRGYVDNLFAELDKLRVERRQLRARLVECRPWVGVCPWPDTPGWRDVIAIRDLADDTLAEVK